MGINAPLTLVMKVMASNAPSWSAKTLAVHVILDSVVMETPVLTTMNVPMVALSVTSTPLATTMMVDTHVSDIPM